MVRSEVGYAGGTTPNPTYHDLEDHAEVLQLEFDPNEIRFTQLVEMFWHAHDPTRDCGRSQYRAILLCENQEQLEVAEASAKQIANRAGRPIHTEILCAPFYAAEAYHQKWQLRRRAHLFEDVLRHYEDEPAMLRSMAATKLNAYVAGNGTREQIARDLDRLGLTEQRARELQRPR